MRVTAKESTGSSSASGPSAARNRRTSPSRHVFSRNPGPGRCQLAVPLQDGPPRIAALEECDQLQRDPRDTRRKRRVPVDDRGIGRPQVVQDACPGRDGERLGGREVISGRSPGPRRQRVRSPWSWCPRIPASDTVRPPRRGSGPSSPPAVQPVDQGGRVVARRPTSLKSIDFPDTSTKYYHPHARRRRLREGTG